MVIKISRQLTHEQYIKLFSNPVCGIACEVDDYNRDHRVKWCCQNIRYSKSMLIKALEFWSNQLFKFYIRITRITNPLEPTKDVGQYICKQIDEIDAVKMAMELLPNSFLFSHKYIEVYHPSRYSDGMKLQKKLLEDKYGKDMWFQHRTVDPFYIQKTSVGIGFNIFPNEHPYIKRAVIAEVGQTNKGNTFIITKK